MSNFSIGLIVGLPMRGGPVMPEWAIALAMQNYPMNTNVMFTALKGLPVDEARNRIVKHAIEQHAKYVWFLDDDVAAPSNAARQLIFTLEQCDDKTMVAGGIYCAKWIPTEPIVYRGDGEGAFWKWKVGEVFECSGIGTGCMVIRTEVFQHLPEPWFKTVDIETPGLIRHTISDDLYFCQKVREAGFKIVADSSVQCIHWDTATGQAYMLPDDSYPVRKNGS